MNAPDPNPSPFLDDDPNAWADPARWGNPPADPPPARNPRPGRPANPQGNRPLPPPRGQMMYGDHGLNQAFGGFNMAQTMAGQQGGHLAGMANQVSDAIGGELQSRVAQQREARRMEHERQMKQMEIDAMLQRLQQAQQMQAAAGRAPISSGEGFAIY